MAIYKLKDICHITNGSTPSTKNSIYWVNGTIPFFKRDSFRDINNHKYLITEQYFLDNPQKADSLNAEGVLVSGNNTLEVIYKKAGWYFKDHIFLIKPKDFRVESKYLYLALSSLKLTIFKKYSTQNSLFKVLESKGLKEVELEVPDVKEQKEIIDIIEPKIDLFKKYSNLVDLSDGFSTQKSLNNLIDIIEPLENMILTIDSLISCYTKFATKVIDLISNDETIKKLNCIIGDLFSLPTTAIEIAKELRGTKGVDYFRGTELSFKDSPIKIPNTILSKNQKISNKLTQQGDILVQKIRHIKILCPRKEVLHNGSVINFRPSNKQNIKYLHLLLLSLFNLMQKKYMYHGTKMPQLLINSFLDHKVCLPERKTQDYLSIISSGIETLSLLIEKINKQKSLLVKYLIN